MEGCLGRFLGATESGPRSTCSGRVARPDTSDRTYSLGESAPSSIPRAITPPARLLLVSARARTPVLTATRHRPCQGRRRPARDSTGSAVRDHRYRRLSRRASALSGSESLLSPRGPPGGSYARTPACCCHRCHCHRCHCHRVSAGPTFTQAAIDLVWSATISRPMPRNFPTLGSVTS
jgi:hypothetical protein